MCNANRHNIVAALLASFGAFMVYAGCKDDSASDPAGATTGSLTVTILGLQGGINANVIVTGPNSFNQVLTGTQTLSSLAVGTYTVTVNNVVTSGAIVSELYRDSTGSSTISVTAGATAHDSVQYAVRPGTGKLWVPFYSVNSFGGYIPSQLAVSGSPTPNVAIGTGVTNQAVAFDRDGNAWVSTFTNNTILRFTPAQLASSGIPTPAVVISANGGSLNQPVALVFDAGGNLWVGSHGNATLVKYTSSQLTNSGAPAPVVIIGGTALNAPVGMAFDASGSLWVANYNNNALVKYTPSQLTSTGTPTPDVTVTLSGLASGSPAGLAFDMNGSLCVANSVSNKLLVFTPGQLATSGSPTPAAIITTIGVSLSTPRSLAFDNSGNLWVVNVGSSTMVQFSAAQLVSSGSPVPAIVISGLGSLDGALLAFNPPPANLPIYR